MSFSCPVPSFSEAKAISNRKNVWNLRINGILVYFSFCLLCNTPSNALFGASFEAQMVKNLPAIWETQVQSLGWEDPVEKEMAAHSSILAWRITWSEEPGGQQTMGSQRVGHD